MTTSSLRARGWLETLEPGIYRRHRGGCASSRDRRPGRRCRCRLVIAVPGSRPRATTLETLEPGTTFSEARAQRRRRQAAGRSVAAVESVEPRTMHELAVAYFRAKEPLLAPSTIRGTDEAYRLR